MFLKYIFFSGIIIFTSSCGNITLNKEVIGVENITPEVIHKVEFKGQQSQGLVLDHKKKSYGKNDSTYKCLNELKFEKNTALLDFDGNITNENLTSSLNFDEISYFNGIPYKIFTNEFLNKSIYLEFYDLNGKVVSSSTVNLLTKIPLSYKISSTNFKINIINKNSYVLHGVLESNNNGNRLFLVKISNNILTSFTYSEPYDEIKQISNSIILPDGDIYFTAATSKEFDPINDLNLLVRFWSAIQNFNYIIISETKNGLGSKPLLLVNGEILVIPERINSTGLLIPINSFSIENFEFKSKNISFSEKSKGNLFSIYQTNNQTYVGYTNELSESKLFKINPNLSLSQSFKLNSLSNFSLISINKTDRVLELFDLTLPENKIQHKIRIQTSYNSFNDKVLYEGSKVNYACPDSNF